MVTAINIGIITGALHKLALNCDNTKLNRKDSNFPNNRLKTLAFVGIINLNKDL